MPEREPCYQVFGLNPNLHLHRNPQIANFGHLQPGAFYHMNLAATSAWHLPESFAFHVNFHLPSVQNSVHPGDPKIDRSHHRCPNLPPWAWQKSKLFDLGQAVS
jgi:hypothetical protein